MCVTTGPLSELVCAPRGPPLPVSIPRWHVGVCDPTAAIDQTNDVTSLTLPRQSRHVLQPCRIRESSLAGSGLWRPWDCPILPCHCFTGLNLLKPAAIKVSSIFRHQWGGMFHCRGLTQPQRILLASHQAAYCNECCQAVLRQMKLGIHRDAFILVTLRHPTP